MKKNTWAARTYHHTTSKYNIYFNGNEAYKEGVAKIEEQNADDFSQVLPVFEDKNHLSFSLAQAEMDYAIEKANKIIQLHSIKKKPKYNPRRLKDPEYREWRNQEEFNRMIDDAYIMMGKATFYKGEFLEAIGIFNHVALKYEEGEAWYLAHLWMARAYAEMGWHYEAGNMLALANDEHLPFNQLQFYNLVSADLHIKKEEYREAVPFLKAALEERLKREKRLRYEFVLAQIYQEEGEDAAAYAHYERVARSYFSYEMAFNARIRMTEVMSQGDTKQVVKSLEKMLKDPKNVEYKGQVYYALGNVYAKTGDPNAAIEQYHLSQAFSQDLQKGLTATTLAEIYRQQEAYLKAQPYYATASENLPEDYPGIDEINYWADVLTDLAAHYSVVEDVHREYLLSQMSEAERAAFLAKEETEAEQNKRIEELIAEAKGEAQKEEALDEIHNQQVGDWYFYNPNLVENGKNDFRKLWGERALKDNWRRSMATNFDVPESVLAEEEEARGEHVVNLPDSLDKNADKNDDAEALADKQSAENENDKSIIDAYFNLALLYRYDIGNYREATAIYEALEAQYPDNSHSPDSYFGLYNIAKEAGDIAKAREAEHKLINDYPTSDYALILSNPKGEEMLLEDKKKYNALYEETFKDFVQGNNNSVLTNTKRLKTEFRNKDLMAKVLLMEALAIGKVQYPTDIRPQLEHIKKHYPDDREVNEQVDVILSQLESGKAISPGGSAANTLAERRSKTAEEERAKIIKERRYRNEPEARHYMVLILPKREEINQNQLQYDVAKFNFNKFMTMDFDLSFGHLNDELTLMVINGFPNKEEGKWYQNEFLSAQLLDAHPTIKQMYIISEENFRLLLLLGTLEEYERFERH